MMLKTVAPENRVQWETFINQDEYATRMKFPTWGIMLSDKMADMILSYRKWQPTRYFDDDSQTHKIGYGYGDPDADQGHTEAESYAEFRGRLRNVQRTLSSQLPLTLIPQSTFDALFSLYLDTGTWRTLKADEGVYDLADAVKNAQWLLCADIMSRGIVNPEMRKLEARVLYLADYAIGKDRKQQTVQGIFELRKRYVGGIADQFEKLQAEFAYYRQFGSFLPGMSDLRKRRIKNQARS